MTGHPLKPHAPCRTLSQGSIETDKSGESMTEEVPIKSENNGTGSAVEDNGSQQGNESPEAEEGTQPTIDSDPASCNYKPQDTDYDEPSSLPVPASDESNDEESNTDKETEEQEASDGSDDDDDNSGNISKSLLAKFLHH
ncbi:hypothetical protein BaRGS_00031930 [Batillaria attramentaria]|uniref:Uncharacterized protein n=1 Tax=Batillaria attramentaria TaxID=370345 RepID=A0ABD0JQ80_9CAEN